MNTRSSLGLASLQILWIGFVTLGLICLWTYETSAGRLGPSVTEWPAGTSLVRTPGQLSMVIFLHPQCPCSKVTVRELHGHLARGSAPCEVWAVFPVPKGVPPEWVKGPVWELASSMPRTQCVFDEEGKESVCFGAHTSGLVLVYDLEGRQVFRGGITIARGHAGQNPGSATIEDLLSGKNPQTSTFPVFGCPLHDRDQDEDLQP